MINKIFRFVSLLALGLLFAGGIYAQDCVQPNVSVCANTTVCTNIYRLTASALASGNEGLWEVVSTPGGGTASFASPNSPSCMVRVDGWGEYVFRWTEAYLGRFGDCEDSEEVTIGFYPEPTNTFTYTPITCYGQETTITYQGNMSETATYNWNFNGATVTSGAGMGPYTLSWINDGTTSTFHNVTLNITEHGCSSQDTVVSIFTPTELKSSVDITNCSCFEVCDGVAHLSNNGGTLPYSYSWASPTNTMSSLCAGNYNVVVTDANGCSVAHDFTITQPSAIDIYYTYTKDLTCYRSENGVIRFMARGGSGTLRNIWSDMGNGSSIRNGLSAGTYSVVVQDTMGCTATQEFTISQPDELLITISNSTAICQGTESNIQVSGFGGTMPYTINWDSGNGYVAGGEDLNVTLDATTTYNVYIKDNNNCISDTVTSTVTVSPTLEIDNIITQNVTCYNACNGRAEVVMHGGIQPYQYGWDSDNTFIENLCAGMYTITITDFIGCNTSASFFISQPDSIMASITATPATCSYSADGSASITVQGGMMPYTYLWPDGTTGTTVTSAPGTIAVTVTDANGCNVVNEVTVGGPIPIYIVPISEQTICRGQTAMITTQVTGGTPGYNYAWGGDGQGSFSNIFVVSPMTTTTYTLTVTDAHGCTAGPVDAIVNVNPELNIVSVYTSYDTICPGGYAEIYVETEGGNGGPYTLTLGDQSIVSSPFQLQLETTSTIYVTLSDMCGTKPVTDSIQIVVMPTPDVNVSAQKVVGCAPFTAKFESDSDNIESILWQFGDGKFADVENPSHEYSREGLYTVSVEIVDKLGCHHRNTIQDMITVHPSPKALFNTDPEIISSLNAEITFINYSTGAERYYWFFGDNDSSVFESPKHRYRDLGEYEVMLVAENEFLCRDTTVRNLAVQGEYAFYAPTSFTPNGDGVNDCFRICGNGITNNEYMFVVYDRWGGLVFKSQSYYKNAGCDSCGEGAWDGTDWGSKKKGDKVCATGIYYWYCRFQDWNGVPRQYQGEVYLAK